MTTTAGPTEATLTPAPAHIPRAPAPATYLGVLLGLLLVAAGVVGIRDGIVSAGWLEGSMWTANAVNWLDGLGFDDWMYPVAILALLLGLVVLFIAVKPSRTTAVPLRGRTTILIRNRDVARIAESAAQTVPGVTHARAESKGRTVTVRARTTGQDAATAKEAVSHAVGSALGILASPAKIVVHTRSESVS
ncbi:DUF6286 domain-containing protein [Mycolicibacterium mengxianglii]|uniref:DUF6286 domain-containing protein n=1 Tax=Mycolicibacterium mengxianglii TaxID=2736649 RepID=UPI0018D045C7|nr:DUF6286 domain-containing protein [Mycolicibacterium mengxianglii]